MKSVKDLIATFYNENQAELEQSYPGLRVPYLLEKFIEYSGLKENETYLKSHDDFFEQLKIGTPLEYLTHSKFFYRSQFYVNNHVLIPRSETEILVEKAVLLIQNNELKSVAEVGVGSGCISLSIAQEVSRLDLIGTDISQEAIEVAKINLQRHRQMISRDVTVKFRQADKLSGIDKTFDMIVSNPPYIKNSDEVHINTKFEPNLALFIADDNYNSWFEDLFNQVTNKLTEKGIFLMEGHEDHLNSLQTLASQYFTRTEILQDYTQRDRFLLAYK